MLRLTAKFKGSSEITFDDVLWFSCWQGVHKNLKVCTKSNENGRKITTEKEIIGIDIESLSLTRIEDSVDEHDPAA